jgi:hypothetical protein
MAQLFFAWVAEARGLSTAEIEAQQAALYLGKDAVAAGLVDVAASWDAFLAAVVTAPPERTTLGTDTEAPGAATMTTPAAPAAKAQDDDNKDDDSLRAKLAKAADGGDAKAARALKAYDAEDEKDDDKAEDDEEKDAKAEDEKDDGDDAKAQDDDEEKDDDAKSKAEARAAAAEALAIQALTAGLPSDLAEALSDPALSPEQVAKITGALPPKAKADSTAAVPQLAKPPARGTRAKPTDVAPAVPADEMSIKMGLVETEHRSTYDGTTLRLGVSCPKEIK